MGLDLDFGFFEYEFNKYCRLDKDKDEIDNLIIEKCESENSKISQTSKKEQIQELLEALKESDNDNKLSLHIIKEVESLL